MAKSIKPTDLGKALSEQLGIYHEDVIERVNDAGRRSIKKLVKLTKASIPVRTGRTKQSLTSTETDDKTSTGMKRFTWGAKAPNHRVIHLIVHGHATKGGGRTKGDPFLQNALDVVLPEYEAEVKEALKS